MIIGNGNIASVIQDKENILFFASGVSNSQEIRESEYQREINLLMQQDRNQHIVYFSSLCVFYSKGRYSQHKLEMERTVKSYFSHYTIVRLGNLLWDKNPHTIINFFRDKINKNESFEIKDEYRFLVSKDEFQYWLNMIPEWNCEMNVPGKLIKVEQIVNEIKLGKL